MKKYTNTLITLLFLIGASIIFTFPFVKGIDRIKLIEITDSGHTRGKIGLYIFEWHIVTFTIAPDGSPVAELSFKAIKWVLQ